jgi:folate-dependent phosphoribosylglycinamide formyltransferase PurN
MIGILSTLDNPMLPGYLASLEPFGLSDYSVICDSRSLTGKQQQLFLDRLGGWSPEDHFDFHIAKDAYNTPFYFVDNHNSPDAIALIRRLNCKFLLNAGTPRKLDASVLRSAKYGVLNVHPGALPNYRGKNCPEWAVYYNDSVVLTAHIMDIEYDEGDVLGIESVDWRSLSSYVEFRKQVYLKSFRLASSVALSLYSNKCTVLYNSKDAGINRGIHEAMDDETLEIVKRRFKHV